MIKVNLDIVIVLGCILLILLGVTIGLGVGGKFLDVATLLVSIIAAGGSLLAGAAAYGAFKMWRMQHFLPRGLTSLDEACEVLDFLKKCSSSSLEAIYRQELKRITSNSVDSLISPNEVATRYTIEGFSELYVFDPFGKVARARDALTVALQKYDDVYNKCNIFGYKNLLEPGLVISGIIKIHAEFHRKCLQVVVGGDVKQLALFNSQASLDLYRLLKDARDQVTNNYKAG